MLNRLIYWNSRFWNYILPTCILQQQRRVDLLTITSPSEKQHIFWVFVLFLYISLILFSILHSFTLSHSPSSFSFLSLPLYLFIFSENLAPGAKTKMVFITSRIHPGESPSSYVCQGYLLSFLCVTMTHIFVGVAFLLLAYATKLI